MRAWIEIYLRCITWMLIRVALRVRAWIEIAAAINHPPAPPVALRVRAWIEMRSDACITTMNLSPSV